MREAAGQSIKSSVFHSWTRDTRDDSLFGTRGSYLKAFQELAGFGGDASFFKAEGTAQLARPLLPGLVSDSRHSRSYFTHKSLVDSKLRRAFWPYLAFREAYVVLRPIPVGRTL